MTNWGTCEALVIEAATAAETLADPTTVAGRTVELKNNGNVTQTWSSTGATPFVVGGVNSATLVLAVGQSARLYSNGTRWVVTGGPGARAVFAGTAVSDAAGNVTFAFPVGLFPAAPVVGLAIQFPAGQNPIDYRITALTATSCTINVRQSPALIVLSLSVLGLSAPLAGVTVHAIATPAGATP